MEICENRGLKKKSAFLDFRWENVTFLQKINQNEEEESQAEEADLMIEDPRTKVPKVLKTKFFKELKKKKIPNRKRLATYFMNDFQDDDSLLSQTQKSFKTLLSSMSSKLNLTQKQIVVNHHKINGTWKNEKLHGQVKILFSDNAKFKGQYENGIRVKGIYEFPDGNLYEGEFFGQKIQGIGTLFLTNSTIIKGKWTSNSLEGMATVYYPSGDIYYGSYENFKKEGFGYYFFHNKTKYIGEFKDGRIDGFGDFYDENEVRQCSGLWREGCFVENEDDLYYELGSRRKIKDGKTLEI